MRVRAVRTLLVLSLVAAVAWVLRAMRGGPAPALEHPPKPSEPWPPLPLRPEEEAVAAAGTAPITATDAVEVDLKPSGGADEPAVWTVQVGDGEVTTIEVLSDDEAEAALEAEIEAEEEAVAGAKILMEGDAAAIIEPEPTIDPDSPPPVEAGWVAEAIAGAETTPPAPPPAPVPGAQAPVEAGPSVAVPPVEAGPSVAVPPPVHPQDVEDVVLAQAPLVDATSVDAVEAGEERSGDASWVEPVDGACPVTHPVKAKLSSGIFHAPGGLNYLRTNPDRCYVSVEAAEADGLRSSKR